jgi:hypothetical protein
MDRQNQHSPGCRSAEAATTDGHGQTMDRQNDGAARTWIPQRSGRGGHDGRDERVGLAESRVVDVEALDGDAVERGVVQDHDGVGVERQALERQQRVVRLHDHVRSLVLVGEHAAQDRQDRQTSVRCTAARPRPKPRLGRGTRCAR